MSPVQSGAPILLLIFFLAGILLGAIFPSGAAKPLQAGETKAPRREPYRAAVEHVLFLHTGSFQGKSTRSLEEAVDLARSISSDVREGKAAFEDACRKLSEDEVTAPRGGFIGIFTRNELAAEFEPMARAIFALEVGEVSAPVETPLGVHVFRRVPIREWSASHILFQWSGCRNAPRELTRTRDEARALAAQALEEASRPGADFADLARRRSEAPDRVQGGSFGIFTVGQVLPALEREISKIEIGRVAGPIETDLGFHVLRRDPLRRARAAHILIRFRGAADADDVTRTREEALEAARQALAEARRPGADFAALARERSEDGSSVRGGDVGLFTPGEMHAAFEKAAFALEVGAVSDVVETPQGFHIIQRLAEE